MQLSAFRQDRANRLPEQTQRRVYGGAARAPRRSGGIVKFFHWEALKSLRPVFYPKIASVLLNINKKFTEYLIMFYWTFNSVLQVLK